MLYYRSFKKFAVNNYLTTKLVALCNDQQRGIKKEYNSIFFDKVT